jgi:hypothetical protein
VLFQSYGEKRKPSLKIERPKFFVMIHAIDLYLTSIEGLGFKIKCLFP